MTVLVSVYCYTAAFINQQSPGAMAEYMKYPKDAINHKVCLNTVQVVHILLRSLVPQVPKSIPPWQAAFIEPLACSIHSVELGNIQFNDVVVVSGCGPLGLGMVAAARLKNPKLLVALDLFDWKVEGMTLLP